MKQFDLKSLGVKELNEQELLTVEGGNIFTKIGEAISNAASVIAEAASTVAAKAVEIAHDFAQWASELEVHINEKRII